MREHSGSDGNSGAKDPTLKDNAGRGGTARGGDQTEGASFEVAADHDEPGAQHSPSARGRGEVSGTDAAAPIDRE